jgi:hypothetical protein
MTTAKAIAIDFGVGDLVSGFSVVTATISEVGKSPFWRCKRCSLPSAPELDRVYQRWRLLYEALSQTLQNTRMEIEEGTIERFSKVELKLLNQELTVKLNDWLNSPGFLKNIKEPLRHYLKTDLSKVSRKMCTRLLHFAQQDLSNDGRVLSKSRLSGEKQVCTASRHS